LTENQVSDCAGSDSTRPLASTDSTTEEENSPPTGLWHTAVVFPVLPAKGIQDLVERHPLIVASSGIGA